MAIIAANIQLYGNVRKGVVRPRRGCNRPFASNNVHTFRPLLPKQQPKYRFLRRYKRLRGKRLTCHIHIVCAALKLSKESLTEYGGAEALKEAVEDIRAALFVRLLFQKMLDKKHLVDGGRDLGNHYAIIVVGVVLRLVGIVGVHRMSKLVSENERIVKRVGIVEKNVRMNTENAAREGSRGLGQHH